MTDIKSMLLSELQEDFALRGLQKFRAAQVYRWLHQRGATSFDEMTDLSKDLRVALKESFEIRNTEIAIRRVSKIDGTKKYLFRLNDGEMIESVLMKYKHGYSICISTQVGCKMGCTFCATGKSGFSRDLLPSEMISEIQTAQKDIGERISNVVLMGMRACRKNLRPCRPQVAADAFRFAACAERRDQKPHHAGQPQVERGAALKSLPLLFRRNGPSHLL